MAAPTSITYYAGGKKHRLPLQGLFDAPQVGKGKADPFRVAPQRMGRAVAATLDAEPRAALWFEALEPEASLIAPADPGRTSVIPTGSIVVEERAAAVRKLEKDTGVELVQEGLQGKVLLRVPGDQSGAVALAAKLSRELVESGRAAAAYPNFVRVLQRPRPSSTSADAQWNLDNDGAVGLVGADVHSVAAWTVTEGDDEVAVAVLDEGVDSRHQMLRAAIVAEADFVEGSSHGRPSGDDAHGTACAGIVASRGTTVRGVAPGVSLVSARIGKGDGRGFWIFDDFQTADGLDWCWDEAGADVLSNSWGGGAPSDAIIRAVGRARTEGRDGKGAVVVFAAGNTQEQIGFPADIDGVLVVGASNQWDERKTRNSADGEAWGSNHGPELDLVAPGVSILTTDITGAAGYDPGNTTATFNGTSAATPHVAGAAALVLSVNPSLGEARVREILCETADPIGRGAVRNDQVGFGRLNCYRAVRQARRG